MASGSPIKVADVDLERVVGICRSLDLTFTEEQVLAIITVIEAGANPVAVVDWLKKIEDTKTTEIVPVSRVP